MASVHDWPYMIPRRAFGLGCLIDPVKCLHAGLPVTESKWGNVVVRI